MAIGSAPEYGTQFTTIHGFNWKHWRITVGDDLMGGYAVIAYPTDIDTARHHKEWEHGQETESTTSPGTCS